MIDKRPKTPREVAAFSLFSMAEEAAWSDGALTTIYPVRDWTAATRRWPRG